MTGHRNTPDDRKGKIILYEEWLGVHRGHMLTAWNGYLLILALAAPVYDRLQVPEVADRLFPYRLLFLAVTLICFLGAHFFHRRKTPVPTYLSIILAITTPSVVNLSHLHMLSWAPSSDMALIAITFLATGAFALYFMQRFSIESLAFLIASCIILIAHMAIGSPDARLDVVLIVVFIAAYLGGSVHRQDFINNLFRRNEYMGALVPRNLANYTTVHHDLGIEDLKEALGAQNRYVVCLCSDWRDFQKMYRSLAPEKIMDTFQIYYDLVFEVLDACDPDGNYFADWVADELFVVFFSETNDQNEVHRRAFNFAHKLLYEVDMKIKAQNMGTNIVYDVGLAAGWGQVGLQGPRRHLKMTVTAEVAGRAKRFESEAKALRRKSHQFLEGPILYTDAELGKWAMTRGYLPEDATVFTVSSGADIRGVKSCYMLRERPSTFREDNVIAIM